ncbi:hypothetical protein O6H91_09G088700 [Diphasiastrum complanatum]|uniref:Uncharacterized protein n=1 Tax=Diphasiastrum complanatum TaxID=34168 RepID=A0ACC2CRY1_DIPCM|nr:hypothetical protein O6H91_09G088700 [Diphasiastrum complanatum]
MAASFCTRVLLLLMYIIGGCFHVSFAQEMQNITLLSKLTPMQNVTWVSPSTNFAMGFLQVGNNAYLLSIWFNNISARTIAWSANRDSLVSNAATLEFTSGGNLVLNNSQSRVWASNTIGLNVIKAEMRDTGNFVLLNQSSQPVWESFNNPTDTLLPNQELKQGLSLISQQSSTNYSSGNFEFTLLSGGRLKLFNRQVFPDASQFYWPGLYDVSSASPLTLWIMGVTGDYGLYNGTGGSALLSGIAADYGSQPPRRLTLDLDGNLRIYSWDFSSESWLQQWKAMTFDCSIDGLCGPYGICYSDFIRIHCGCPPGWHPVDAHVASQGCAIDKPYGCDTTNGSKFAILENTDFPRKYDTASSPYLNIPQLACTQLCSSDCACVGVAYYTDGSGKCYLKVGGLIDGWSKPDLGIRFCVKVASSQVLPPSSPTSASPLTEGFTPSPQPLSPPNPPYTTGQFTCEDRSSRKKGLVISGVASSTVSASVVFILMCVVLYIKRQPRQGGASNSKPPGALSCFNYKEMQTATRNFSETLGSGGFGSVYKGVIPDFGPVAVKKLDKLHQGEKEFKAEVETIGSIHHMNLVRLYGFCSEGSQRLLVYEYLSNGSLDRFLFENHSPEEKPLEWSVRFNIGLGTARAIAYLHEECRECIIHCDIKPQNILLDDQFTPRVSDFGLAKLLQKDQTRTFTTVRGTRGYVAPEWFSNQAITVKADVYSYGMVLLELLAGRKNFDLKSTRLDFGEWAFQQMEEDKMHAAAAEVLQKSGAESQSRLQQVERVVKVALWCVQQDAFLRPTMGKVVQMLEGSVDVSNPPLPKSRSNSNSAQHSDADHQPSASHSLATSRGTHSANEDLAPISKSDNLDRT